MSVMKPFLLLIIYQFITSSSSKKLSGVYVDNEFNQTLMHEIPLNEDLVEEMLNIFDIPEIPKIHRKMPLGKRSAPMFLMDIYNMLDEDEATKSNNSYIQNIDFFDITDENLKNIKESNIIMSLDAQNHKVPGVMKTYKVKRLWFNVSQVFPEDQIINAELRLYRSIEEVRDRRNKGPVTITVYRIATARADDGSRGKVFVDAVNTTEKDGWVTLNITESLQHWVQSSNVNRGLYLRVQAHDRPHEEIRPEEFGIVGFRDDPEKRPFMVGYFRRTKKRRRKNSQYFPSLSLNSSYERLYRRKRSTSCKRESLYINFEDLNWQNWILQPRGYDAYFCHGECNFPLQNDLSATNHAFVQSLVNLRDPSKAPKPCCAPSSLSPISVIYRMDEGNYVMHNRKDMTVESCACH